NNAALSFVQADGGRLPFADAAFARVWGNAILHHLPIDCAGAELYRVLEPGGIAVFCEPWGGNPLLNWARRRLPPAANKHTSDERPLRSEDIACLRLWFPDLKVHGVQLLGMAARLTPSRWLASGLEWCDRALLAGIPPLQKLCRYVMMVLPRPRA